MTFSFLRVPLDQAGKKIRTRFRDIGGDSVHEQYVIAHAHDRIVTTKYIYQTGSLVVGAAADGANVGRVYVENDPDSTVLIVVTRITFRSQLASVLATPTSPRILIRRFSFTGDTPSGAIVDSEKYDTTAPNKNANWNVRTAATGMTITESAASVACFYPVANATAVGQSTPVHAEWKPDASTPLILRAGEGVMVKQADAGTTSDTRLFQIGVDVEEVTLES